MAQVAKLPLSQDAALVVALAGTAIRFSQSADDEAERWLRVLRLHGRVGAALQALGVGEAPLISDAQAKLAQLPPLGGHAVNEVTDRAGHVAGARDAETVATADLLLAVMDVYGPVFDRALYRRGTTRAELIGRLPLADGSPSAPTG